jgi:hypothetical protein
VVITLPIHNYLDFKALCDKLEDTLELSHNLWNEGMNTKGRQISRITEENYEKILHSGPTLSISELRKLSNDGLSKINSLTDSPPQPPSPLSEGEMISVFHLNSKSPFILPPLDQDKEFIPLLSATYEFGITSYRLRFPIAMIRFHEGGPFNFWGIGFRFESKWNGGNHDYFHVQPTPEPFEEGRFSGKLPVFCDWMPSTYPCIPTGARCPVTLLYTLLISLYGKTGFTDNFLPLWGEAIYSHVLKQYWQ